jgi:hypothetical protein
MQIEEGRTDRAEAVPSPQLVSPRPALSAAPRVVDQLVVDRVGVVHGWHWELAQARLRRSEPILPMPTGRREPSQGTGMAV